MLRLIHGAAVLAVIGSSLTAGTGADAQILERVKKRAEQQATRRVERRAEQAVDKALDGAEGAVSCAVTDRACADRAQREGKTVVLTDASGKPVPGSAAAGASAVPGEGVWANYDFMPGERILFVDDFTRDVVGDFPRRLEFVSGSAEIVEWQGRRFVRATAPSAFAVVLPEALGERFTIEFDVHTPKPQHGVAVVTGDWPGAVARYRHHYLGVGHWQGPGVWKQGAKVSATADQRSATEIVRARIMADGPYVKVYVNEKRVGNLPRADLPRGGKLTFWLDARGDSPVYVGDIRVAAGGRDLYAALEASGRVATQGIYFATGSDVLRPESSGTLKEIAQMLQEHPELRLTIEGHTDDVGNAAANRTLSERRAAAVKAALVSSYGVSAARLQTAGFGDSKPAASNATPEGRQQNRRVELVKH